MGDDDSAWEDVNRSHTVGNYYTSHQNTRRLRVPGGWLYRTNVWDTEEGKRVRLATTMAFVPEAR